MLRHRFDLAVLTWTFERDHGYPCGENTVAGPASLLELSALTVGALRSIMPSDLVAWYRQVSQVSLPDVANGYFIHPPGLVVAHAGGEGIRQITGRHEAQVVVFASDGGGTLYAVRSACGTPVYRLPPGSVVDGVYSSNDPRYDIVASDLAGFLDLLRAAVHSFTQRGRVVDL
jgi:hypothetical protein